MSKEFMEGEQNKHRVKMGTSRTNDDELSQLLVLADQSLAVAQGYEVMRRCHVTPMHVCT